MEDSLLEDSSSFDRFIDRGTGGDFLAGSLPDSSVNDDIVHTVFSTGGENPVEEYNEYYNAVINWDNVSLINQKRTQLDNEERLQRDKELQEKMKQKFSSILGLKKEVEAIKTAPPSSGKKIARRKLATNGGIDTVGMLQQYEEDNDEAQKAVNSFVISHEKEAIDPYRGTEGDTTIYSAIAPMVPFAEGFGTARANKVIKGETSWYEDLKAFFIPGSTKDEWHEKYLLTPPKERLALVKKVAEGMRNAGGISGISTNQFYEMSTIDRLTNEADSLEKGFDYITTVADITGVLAPVVKSGKIAKNLGKLKNAVIRKVATGANPSSFASSASSLNKDAAAAVHAMNAMDNTGKSAKATAGASRADAVMEDVTINVVHGDEIPAKVAGIADEAQIKIAEQVEQAKGVPTYLTDKEIVSAEEGAMNEMASVGDDFNTAFLRRKKENAGKKAIQLDPTMSHAKVGNDGKITLRGVYTDVDGGFTSYGQALARAKIGLRNIITDEGDITILRRTGANYEPVTEEMAKKKGAKDFVIQIDTKKPIDHNWITNWETMSPKWNFFDRISSLVFDSSSLTRNVLDNASILDPRLSGALSVLTDRTTGLQAKLVERANTFTKGFHKLPKERMNKVNAYVVEANQKAKDAFALGEDAPKVYDYLKLKAEGFEDNEIKILQDFRDFNRDVYEVRNSVMVDIESKRGTQVIVSEDLNAFGSPIRKDYNVTKAFDIGKGEAIDVSPAYLDKLYDNKGAVVQLRRPVVINGEEVSRVIVRNTPDEHVRNLRSSDKMLNDLGDGYYPVSYKRDRVFVEEILSEGTAKTAGRKRVVAVAGSHKEADDILTAGNLDRNKYKIRQDKRSITPERDAYWDVEAERGMINQRYRGELFEKLDSIKGVDENTVDPFVATQKAASSLTGRAVMGEYLEALRTRIANTYPEQMLRGENGRRMLPSAPSQIVGTTKEAGDARTMIAFLNSVENSVADSVSDTYKAFFNIFAETLGKLSIAANSKTLSAAEKAAYVAGNYNPATVGRKLSTAAYISYNPLRHMILQPMQTLSTAVPLNLTGWSTGACQKLIVDYSKGVMGVGKLSKKSKAFFDWVKETGVMASVDRNILIKDAGITMAAESNAAVRGAAALADLPRQGYVGGEKLNMLSHLATVFDKEWRANPDFILDAAKRQEAHAFARAISLETNAAGDMPWNKGVAGVIMQFATIPWKMITTTAVSRRIPVADRLKMLVSSTALYGLPTGLAGYVLSKTDMPEGVRETMTDGLLALSFNNLIETATGVNPNADFGSGFNPYGVNIFEVFSKFSNDGVYAALAATPAASFASNKAMPVLRDILMLSGLAHQYDEEDPVTFWDALNDVARMSSGWTNVEKARMIAANKEITNKHGGMLPGTANNVTAALQAFGITTKEQRDFYRLSEVVKSTEKEMREDISKKVKELLTYMTSKTNEGNTDVKKYIAVQSILFKQYVNNPVALKMISEEMSRGFSQVDNNVTKLWLRGTYRGGFGDPEAIEREISTNTTLTEEQRKTYKEWAREVKEFKYSGDEE